MYKSESGYTLIEVIISIQVFMIIVSLTYTIYLFGYRFMASWDEKSDLIRQELLVQRLINDHIDHARCIIEITPFIITIVDSDYSNKNLSWSADTLYLNNIPLNKTDLKINFSIISFYDLSSEKLFEEIDINRDGRLLDKELKKINGIKMQYKIVGKKQSFISSIVNKIPESSEIFRTP
jgi:hypothetical protein